MTAEKRIAGENDVRLYSAQPRGIGRGWGPCMVCGGSSEALRHDCAFFVPSRETGEAIVAMFAHRSKLDYRPSEPQWIQVKICACDDHLAQLEGLIAEVSGTKERRDGPGISADMIRRWAKLGGDAGRAEEQADRYDGMRLNIAQGLLDFEQRAGLTFQQRVAPWMRVCFGSTISADTVERNDRFIEEALELIQACGATRDRAHALVDYVFGRPIGEKAQEVGGVMVTLAALCLAQRVDLHDAAETELARVWTKIDQIRAKQAAKPKGSVLPV